MVKINAIDSKLAVKLAFAALILLGANEVFAYNYATDCKKVGQDYQYVCCVDRGWGGPLWVGAGVLDQRMTCKNAGEGVVPSDQCKPSSGVFHHSERKLENCRFN